MLGIHHFCCLVLNVFDEVLMFLFDVLDWFWK